MKRLLFILLLLIVGKANAQNTSVHWKGFLVNVAGSIVFMETNDTTNIFQSIYQQSISVGGMEDRNEQLEQSTQSIGDSIVINVIDGKTSKKYLMTVNYFYCDIEFELELDDEYDIGIYQNPKHIIKHKKNKYPFGTIWIRNKIKKIKFLKEEDLKKFKEYYTSRNYNLPKILD